MYAKTTKPHMPNRNSLTAVNDDGSRYVIHPSDVKGRFTALRRLFAYALILIYALMPWIHVGGYPAVFLDTSAMRFHFFGLTFASQDLWLAFFLISGLGFGLFYVTALLGRIWCGWACPQTVFLEHVFRRVERWIEGDAVARRKLDEAPWDARKLFKRGLKHAVFVGLALVVAHIFMAYFVSIPALWEMMREEPTRHWKAFVFVFTFAGVMYFVFAWFREQLCIVICPYGRLQSALIDEHSMVIGYDEARGEPRGKASDVNAGACIDCNRCVQVCPTGIDIRQGLQLECIGCAACIDACDAVMDRLKRPRGLVRYDSMEGLANRPTKIVRPRMILYTALLLLGAAVLTFSISRIGSATMTAWRSPGDPYFLDTADVRNQFMIRITNKRNEASFYRIEIEKDLPEAKLLGIDDPFLIPGNGELVKPLVITVPKSVYTGGFPMKAKVVNEKGETLAERTLQFIGPEAKLVR